jgi:hypothetical protein
MYLQTGDERLWLRQLQHSFECGMPRSRGGDETRTAMKYHIPFLRRVREGVARWMALVHARQST